METRDLSGKYELGRPLAAGGQGLLRHGKRREDGLDVIIKKYSQMTDDVNWDSYEEGEIGAAREIAFLKRANADGIRGLPKLLDYGTDGGWQEPLSVFQPFEGKRLDHEVLEPGYNSSTDRIRWFFDRIRVPLSYAHHFNGAKPVVHRDVAPNNIMVNGESLVLLDWAAATPTSGKTYHGKTHVVNLYYTAPEVLAGKPFDGRADIYSLGRVLQFIILGKNFEDLEGQPKEEDFQGINIPAGLVRVLEKATNQEPNQRYASIDKFYEDFERAFGNQNLPARTREHISVSERLQPKSLIQTPEFSYATIVGGELGEKVMEIYLEKARELGNPKVLDVLRLKRKIFKPWQRVVKGSNSFSGVLANEALKELGYRISTRPGLEKVLSQRMLNLGLVYVDFGVALTQPGDDHAPTDSLARKLASQLAHRGIDLGTGKLIGFNALTLEKDSNSDYEISYGLSDEATEEDILDLDSFRWDYRRAGLSGACLDGGRGWNADRNLDCSNGDGRVVAVSGEATTPENSLRIFD